MHRRADEAKFRDRAIIGDESRVRGAAGSGELRLPAGHLGDGALRCELLLLSPGPADEGLAAVLGVIHAMGALDQSPEVLGGLIGVAATAFIRGVLCKEPEDDHAVAASCHSDMP